MKLSENDKHEVEKFADLLRSLKGRRDEGASRQAAIREACLEVYGDENGETPEPHVTGEEGVRDTEHPCRDFFFGEPHLYNRCEGDGHYLCNECKNKKAEEDPANVE